MTFLVAFPSDWPEKLPNHEELATAAEDLGKKGKKLTEVYDDTVPKWTALPNSLSVKDDQKLFNAFTTNVAPYADVVNTSLGETKTALNDFATGVEGFKSRWENLKKEVETYNALDAEPADPEDKVDGTSYRTFADSHDLNQRLIDARDDYKTLVETCVDAIKATDSSLDPIWKDTGFKGFHDATKKAWNRSRTALKIAGGFNGYDGNVGFKFNADSPNPTSISEIMRGKIPKWLPESVQNKLKSYLPENPDKYAKNPDGSIKTYPNGDPVPSYMAWSAAISRSPLGKFMKNKLGVDVRGIMDKTATTARVQLNTNIRMPGWADRGTRNMRKLEGMIKKFENNKYVKGGGKVLGALDAVGGYADGAIEGYNNSLRENPDFTPEQHAAEAAKSSATRGTAELVTKVACGAGGRAIGGALGGPVGAFVGGVVGDYVGGKLAPHVADVADAFRKDGLSGAVDVVGEKADAAVESVKETASKVKDKVTGWLGF